MNPNQLYNSLVRKHPGLACERITITQEALRSLVRLAWQEGRKEETPIRCSEVVDFLRGAMTPKGNK